MNLIISLDSNDIKLTLKDANKTISESSWHGEHSLSEQLLAQIDALLQKNGVKRGQVEKVETEISETTGITSRRIVETVAEAWNASKNFV